MFSAIDGPDLLVEELALVSNMNLAIKEERYKDAGTSSIADLTNCTVIIVF